MKVSPALLLAALLVGCAGEPHPTLVPAPRVEPRVVRAVRARSVELSVGDEIVGTVRARNVSALSASVMGHVSALKVSLGSRVRAGQLLVQLSAEEIAAKVGQARATFAQANLELKRAEQLKASQTIPQAQYELAMARFSLAKEALAEADVMRGYTSVRAPFSGVITAKHCEVGDLALPGRPLLVIESEDTPRLEANVPEARARGLQRGQEMSVRIDSLPDAVRGTISELSPSANPASRTVLIKLDLPATPGLRPGMFGRLQLDDGTSRTLLVPTEAVLRRGQLELVFVAEAGRAVLRIVRSGRSANGTTELLSGLDPNELVIITSVNQLVDGQPIEVQP
jgi:membrane fusion protein (multidrug efflux system)